VVSGRPGGRDARPPRKPNAVRRGANDHQTPRPTSDRRTPYPFTIDFNRSRGSGLPAPVTGRSLRAPALRSLHAGYASPSWLRLPPSPAPGHGQPLAPTSLACDSGRGSSRIGGTRRSREWQEVKTLVLWIEGLASASLGVLSSPDSSWGDVFEPGAHFVPVFPEARSMAGRARKALLA